MLNWGNGTADANTNIGAFAPPEPDNFFIASGSLYNTIGILIDIDPIVPVGNYPYIRFTDPGTGDGADLDGIELLH